MTRVRGAWALWLVFAAIVVVNAFVLLPACGLLPLSGLDFCPVRPVALADDAERGRLLAQQARALEARLAHDRLACAAEPKPAPAPLELPTSRRTPRPQQTMALKPPPPPPPLPADRWAKKDLSLLRGCWLLGHDTQSRLGLANGGVDICTVRTGRICFDDHGSGQREKTENCPSIRSPVRCVAPIRAQFDGDTLRTTQPLVNCQPSDITWNAEKNDRTCRRVSDTLAICRDRLNFEHEFRREGS